MVSADSIPGMFGAQCWCSCCRCEFLLGKNHFKGVCFSCYSGWYKANLPFVGEYDLENVGKISIPRAVLPSCRIQHLLL